MNDKKRQEIFRHDSRWVNEFNNEKIRIDHWDEDPNVIRIGTVSNRYIEHWIFNHYEWSEEYKTLYSMVGNDSMKNTLRRLIP